MGKYTKEEIKENRKKVAEMARTEGWVIAKDMVNTFVLETEREIMIAPAEDKDKMLALANKLKFGTGALLWFIQEVDIVVAHNGDGYDIKKVNARMIFHKLPPPEPFKTVDTLKVARKVAGFSSNKLENLVEQLELGKKMDAGGIEVLKGVLKGVKKDWKHLKEYNKMDVVILEKLYYELLPWMTNHPSLAVLNDQPNACPKCGSTHLRKGGFYITKTGKYKRYLCLNCGGWTHGRKKFPLDVKYVD